MSGADSLGSLSWWLELEASLVSAGSGLRPSERKPDRFGWAARLGAPRSFPC